MSQSALVVGMGACGLFASYLLSKKGWKVTVVGHGTPASAMSTGCVRGAMSNERCLHELQVLSKAVGMPMNGPGVGVTNLGTRFDCSMSPSRSILHEGMPETITAVGIGGHPSLRPRLAASMLSEWVPRAEAMTVDVPVPADMTLDVAFRDEALLDLLVGSLKETDGTVLIPPLFRLADHWKMDDLERRSGRTVLEAITPLGIPGQRFLDMFIVSAKDAGAVLWPGRKVTELRTDGGEVHAEVTGGLESRSVRSDAVLLATGGPLVDGLLLPNDGLVDPFGTFRTVGSQGIGGGYEHDGPRLRFRSGGTSTNAFGAGDCLSSGERTYGNGLAAALESAWDAVQAMEGP